MSYELLTEHMTTQEKHLKCGGEFEQTTNVHFAPFQLKVIAVDGWNYVNWRRAYVLFKCKRCHKTYLKDLGKVIENSLWQEFVGLFISQTHRTEEGYEFNDDGKMLKHPSFNWMYELTEYERG